MNVKWLLEPEVFQDDMKHFLETLEKHKIEHVICHFGKSYDAYLDDFTETDCVVFHGSLQLGRLIQQKAKWIPGVYCNLKKLDCQYYYPRFGGKLLNSDYVMLPFGDLQRKRDQLLEIFGENQAFVRPSSGFKAFTGKVFTKDAWNDEVKKLQFRMDPETLVVVARAKKIDREWRLVVGENRIVAATQYKEGEKTIRSRGAPDSLILYANEVLQSVRYKPDRIWTLDIGESVENLYVLECGSFSCAGLYACDPELVIPEVNKIAWKEYEEY